MARKSLVDLATDIATLLADNDAGNISEADLRQLYTDVKDSFAHLDITDQLASDIAALAAQVAADLALKQDIGNLASAGVALSFDKNRQYGTEGAPENGANVTLVPVGAKIGAEVMLIHQAGAEPAYGAQFKKLAMSSAYSNGNKNYYWFKIVDAGKVIFWISN